MAIPTPRFLLILHPQKISHLKKFARTTTKSRQMIRIQETNNKIRTVLDIDISLKEQFAQMNDKRQLFIHIEITRNVQISRNDY